MKLSNLVFLASIIATVGGAEDGEKKDHDHPDGDKMNLTHCDEYNVTDKVTCMSWCDEEGHFEIVKEHGDTIPFETEDGAVEGPLHTDRYDKFVCHCEHHDDMGDMMSPADNTTTATSRAGHDHDEKSCMEKYEFPTCESVGLADCGENATKTCDELCAETGLGVADEDNYCVHGEAEEGHHDHDHRFLSNDESHDDDDEHHAFTMCFCGGSKAGRGTMVCADKGWEDEDAHGDTSSSPALAGGFAVATLAAFAVATL